MLFPAACTKVYVRVALALDFLQALMSSLKELPQPVVFVECCRDEGKAKAVVEANIEEHMQQQREIAHQQQHLLPPLLLRLPRKRPSKSPQI